MMTENAANTMNLSPEGASSGLSITYAERLCGYFSREAAERGRAERFTIELDQRLLGQLGLVAAEGQKTI